MGNVKNSSLHGINAVSENEGLNLIAKNSISSPVLLILNDAPSDINWKKIIEANNYISKGIPNKYLIKIKLFTKISKLIDATIILLSCVE